MCSYRFLMVVIMIFMLSGMSFSLTDKEFFEIYDNAVDSGLDKLTLMHHTGTDALGTETVYGDNNGTLTYNAEVSKRVVGIPSEVTVTLEFDDYSENGVYLNGTLTTVVDKLLKKMGTSSGTIKISGEVDGTVRYETSVEGPKVYDGYYYISQDDSEESEYYYDYFK